MTAAAVLTWAAVSGCAITQSRYKLARRPMSPYLIFDRVPPSVDATTVGRNRDPRTVATGVEVFQDTQYTEYFVDRQDGQGDLDNDFYRRFTTRRTGLIAR